jgi:demethylspheroidene O-methyltransferase
VSWTDRFLKIRDRWLSSPKFQRWAAAFPLTRPTARRHARALFDVCAGFVYSQILYACVHLKLFDLLAAGPETSAGIAAKLDVPPDSTQRLLEAAVSLRLLERRAGERFGLGVLGAALVGNPAVSAMIEHNRLLYADLCDPVRLLRREQRPTRLSSYWTYGTTSEALPSEAVPSEVSPSSDAPRCDYTELMANSQPLVAGEILDAYPLTKHRCLLDVGGGDGSFLVEVSKRSEQIQLVLFDLPPVAERASKRFETLGLGNRAKAVGGDFLTGILPSGADVISLVRVIHDHDDGPAAAILTAVYQALPLNGVLLLAEPMMGTPGAAPVGDAYFGFYLLAMGRGRPRTPQQLQQLLRGAGFATTQLVGTHQPLQGQLIVARKQAR